MVLMTFLNGNFKKSTLKSNLSITIIMLLLAIGLGFRSFLMMPIFGTVLYILIIYRKDNLLNLLALGAIFLRFILDYLFRLNVIDYIPNIEYVIYLCFVLTGYNYFKIRKKLKKGEVKWCLDCQTQKWEEKKKRENSRERWNQIKNAVKQLITEKINSIKKQIIVVVAKNTRKYEIWVIMYNHRL